MPSGLAIWAYRKWAARRDPQLVPFPIDLTGILAIVYHAVRRRD